MAIPTITEIEEGKQDLDDLEAMINGGITDQVTTRLGGTKPSVAKAVQDAIDANVFLKAPRKNALINGAFDVWQRGTSLNITSPSAQNKFYLADRWIQTGGAGGCLTTVSRQSFSLGNTVVPTNPTYYMQIDRTVAATGDTNIAMQYVEDVRTFAGQDVTFSFYAKCGSGTKVIRLNIVQWFDSSFGGSPTVIAGTTSFTLTTSFQRFEYSVTLPSISGKTLGPGHALLVSLFEASPYSTFTVDLACCQLEKGTAATEFEMRTFDEELALCERYYEKSYNINDDPGTTSATKGMITYTQTGTTAMNHTLHYRTRKRANPILTIYDPYAGTAGQLAREYNVQAAVSGGSIEVGECQANVGLIAVGADNTRYHYHYTAEAEVIY